MAQLNTRVVLRNDSLANWENNKNVVLLKGEFGVAFDTDGTPKIKIGDGIKTWAELDWFQDGSAPIEGVTNEQLSALSQELSALASIVGKPATDTSSATGIYGDIAALAESMGLLVDERIDAFANAITDDGKINTVMELIEYVDRHGAETAELVSNVNRINDQMSNVIQEIVVNGVLCDVVNNRVEIELTGVIKSSDDITVNEDGTLSINKIDAGKLVTQEGSSIILNGGSASV